jgi:transposase
VHDNASYPKKQETYDWFRANRRYLEVFQLPPYWPELNATERVWKYTCKYVNLNRFYERLEDLGDALFSRFDYVRHHPQEISGLLHFAAALPFGSLSLTRLLARLSHQ